MKDATGELSMTAVAVVAIAAIGAILTLVIIPAIKQSVLRKTYCASAFNCKKIEGQDDMMMCDYYDGDGKLHAQSANDGLECSMDTSNNGIKNGN